MAAKVKVILLERIARLGELGDEVAVAAGYARNWLFRQHKAVPATAQHRADFNARREELERAQLEQLQAAQALAEQWGDLALQIQVQAGPGGKMYGSVAPRELVAALRDKGLEVENRQILLPYALRTLGEHSLAVELHPQVRLNLTLTLTATGSEAFLAEDPAERDSTAEAPAGEAP